MSGKYVLRETSSGMKFDLKAGNGEVILSSQVYSTIQACRKGVESVRANAKDGATEDQTLEAYIPEKHPKFELYMDKAGDFRFRLKAKNGQIVGTSEAYKSKASCLKGIESVRNNAPEAPLKE